MLFDQQVFNYERDPMNDDDEDNDRRRQNPTHILVTFPMWNSRRGPSFSSYWIEFEIKMAGRFRHDHTWLLRMHHLVIIESTIMWTISYVHIFIIIIFVTMKIFVSHFAWMNVKKNAPCCSKRWKMTAQSNLCYHEINEQLII